MIHTFKKGDKVRVPNGEATVKSVIEDIVFVKFGDTISLWPYLASDLTLVEEKETDIWFVNSCGLVDSIHFVNDTSYNKRLAFGNVFKSEADAEAAAERVRKALKNEI